MQVSRPLRVQKYGRSLFVCLPQAAVKALAWRRGDYLVAAVAGESVVLRRIQFAPYVTDGRVRKKSGRDGT